MTHMRQPSRRILLEIAIGSVEDAITAESGGADRVELNSALALGGLTPSLGLLVQTRGAVKVPIIAMARPRPSGFFYSDREFQVMLQDVELLLAHGADGIAFGVLTDHGEIDVPRCRKLVDMIGTREAVFHRAFDVTGDPCRALEQLIDLGIRRVMTSGQEGSAPKGIRRIAQLVEQSRGRIEILPAAGINARTLAVILAETGCDQVHASLRGQREDPSTRARPQVRFGSTTLPPEDRYDATDADAVVALRSLLDAQS